ncbi:MAG: hypothetical protein V1728_00110 [Candidatus Micrarchaeota archaeon]
MVKEKKKARGAKDSQILGHDSAKKTKTIEYDTFVFHSGEGAQIAASILPCQLTRFEDVESSAKAKGKEVGLKISSPDAASVRASRYTAARLAKLMRELDGI